MAQLDGLIREGVLQALAHRDRQDQDLIDQCRRWHDRMVVGGAKKVFTNEEFRKVLRGTHPECQNAEWREEAFKLIRLNQKMLRASEEKDWRKLKGITPLPTTVEGLMAAKAARQAEKRSHGRQ